MEYISVKRIKGVISSARQPDDAQTLQVLGRSILHTKAALYAHALAVYQANPHLRGIDWRLWVKHALKPVCSAKDISLIIHGTVVLARLDEAGITDSHGAELCSWDFITSRLTYLQDALATLKQQDHSAQGNKLFRKIIVATAEMSRADLRAFLDMLNFKDEDRAACYRKAKGQTVTYTIICSPDQAEKLEARLQLLVAMK
jgi:hypothetical protein